MDSPRQVIRWSIPGFVFVTVFLILHGARSALTYGVGPWSAISQLTGSGVVALFFGGIPVGFIIYQLYYATYRSQSRFFGHILFLRADRGGLVLSEYTRRGGSFEVLKRIDVSHSDEQTRNRIETSKHSTEPSSVFQLFGYTPPQRFKLNLLGFKLLKLKSHICGESAGPPSRCDGCSQRWEKNFILNWSLYQTLLDLASTCQRFQAVKNEYTSGSDLYHALGASRRALSLATLGVVSYETMAILNHRSPALPHGDSLGVFVVWICIVFATWFAIWRPLTICRRNTDDNYRRRVGALLALITREFSTALWDSSDSTGPTRVEGAPSKKPVTS